MVAVAGRWAGSCLPVEVGAWVGRHLGHLHGGFLSIPVAVHRVGGQQ